MQDIRLLKIFFGMVIGFNRGEAIGMAVWQFEFYTIPKGRIKFEGSEDDILSWESNTIPYDFESKLSQIMSITNSYNNVFIYGESDKTCIHLLKKQGAIIEILCKLDLRNLSKELIIKMIELIKSISGDIYVDGVIFDPEFWDIASMIRNSKAAQFCINPTGYLEEYER